jgi:hypothetical protein
LCASVACAFILWHESEAEASTVTVTEREREREITRECDSENTRE